jgi:IS5 family transposase
LNSENYKKTKKSGGKNKEARLEYATKEYLNIAEVLDKKIAEFITIFKPCSIGQTLKILELEYYKLLGTKHIDLVERRLIKGEKIPHSEKVFSLLEPHTKWISKGKAGVICELGQKHLIVTAQYHFIIHHKLIGDTPDAAFTIEIAQKLKEKFGECLASLSFDKGFSSKEIITELESIIPNAIIKQKGKPHKARQEIEHTHRILKKGTITIML